MLQLEYFTTQITLAHRIFNDCIRETNGDKVLFIVEGTVVAKACREIIHREPTNEQGIEIIEALMAISSEGEIAEACGIFALAHDLSHIFSEGPEVQH